MARRVRMYTGWRTMNNKVYYFQKGNADGNIGKMYTGQRTINDKVYYFQMGGETGERGKMYTRLEDAPEKIPIIFKWAGKAGQKARCIRAGGR